MTRAESLEDYSPRFAPGLVGLVRTLEEFGLADLIDALSVEYRPGIVFYSNDGSFLSRGGWHFHVPVPPHRAPAGVITGPKPKR